MERIIKRKYQIRGSYLISGDDGAAVIKIRICGEFSHPLSPITLLYIEI